MRYHSPPQAPIRRSPAARQPMQQRMPLHLVAARSKVKALQPRNGGSSERRGLVAAQGEVMMMRARRPQPWCWSPLMPASRL